MKSEVQQRNEVGKLLLKIMRLFSSRVDFSFEVIVFIELKLLQSRTTNEMRCKYYEYYIECVFSFDWSHRWVETTVPLFLSL